MHPEPGFVVSNRCHACMHDTDACTLLTPGKAHLVSAVRAVSPWAEKRGAMFRYLILGLLRGGEAYHGYALMKGYRERSGIRVSAGNFYRELQRLVGEGLIRVVVNPSDVDPRRAPYEITENGATAFDAWLGQPMTGIAPSYEDEISSRALFVAGAGPIVVQRVLGTWQDDLWLQGKILERDREAALARRRTVPPRFEPLTLLLARRLKHVVADLEFIEEFRAAYAAFDHELGSETAPPVSQVMEAAPASTQRTKSVKSTRRHPNS